MSGVVIGMVYSSCYENKVLIQNPRGLCSNFLLCFEKYPSWFLQLLYVPQQHEVCLVTWCMQQNYIDCACTAISPMCLSKLVALCITRHMKWNHMPLCSMLPPKHEEVSHVQGFTVLEGAECINLPFTLEAISWYPNYWMPIKLIYAVTHTFLE